MVTEPEIRADAAVAPAPDTTSTTPEKVIFNEAQQKKLSDLIKQAQSRAAGQLRAELAAAKEELATKETELALHRQALSPELAETRQRLAEESGARQAAETRLRIAETTVQLRDALANEGVINLADAVRLVQDSVAWKDGQLQGSDGRSLAEVAKDFAADRPFMVRSSVRGGVGATSAERPLADPRAKLETLFGRGSNAVAANKLAMRDPQEYRRQRALAVEAGLLGA